MGRIIHPNFLPVLGRVQLLVEHHQAPMGQEGLQTWLIGCCELFPWEYTQSTGWFIVTMAWFLISVSDARF